MSQEVGTGKSRRGLPIELGGALITLVEPHPGHEVDYNRWYERDHFYAGCMVGAWTLSGARFVATNDLKQLRPTDTALVDDRLAGSYLSLYWLLAGKFGEWIEWGTRQVKYLIENDRMFPHRDHVHTVMYRFVGEVPGREDGVPIELALDHRATSLVMTLVNLADGCSGKKIQSWWADNAPGQEVAGVFEPVPMPAEVPSEVPAATETQRALILSFVDEDVSSTWSEAWAEVPAKISAAGLGAVAFHGPFKPTVPGTDTYADQLR